MKKKAGKQPRRVIPVARSLRLRAAAPRVAKPKKGKGSYRHRGRAGAQGTGVDGAAE